MAGIDRLNVPTIDTFSHSSRGLRTTASVPFLVGVLHYQMYNRMCRCIKTSGRDRSGCI